MSKCGEGGSAYDPSRWTHTVRSEPDGTRVYTYENGMAVHVPPRPRERDARIARDASAVNYAIAARIAAEKE